MSFCHFKDLLWISTKSLAAGGLPGWRHCFCWHLCCCFASLLLRESLLLQASLPRHACCCRRLVSCCRRPRSCVVFVTAVDPAVARNLLMLASLETCGCFLSCCWLFSFCCCYCCRRTLFASILNDDGVPAFAVVNAVACISAVIRITAVAASTAVAGFTAFDGVPVPNSQSKNMEAF